jgi:tight adherence protein B
MSLLVVTFAAVFGVMMVSLAVGMRVLEARRRRRVAGVVKITEAAAAIPQTTVLVQRTRAAWPALARIISRLKPSTALETLLAQSGLGWEPSRFALLTLGCAAGGALLALKLRILVSPVLSVLGLAALGALLPFLFVRRKRAKRLAEFEAQFPEALDFMARAMRAGHAFPTSLEMLSVESPDPLRSEFRRVFNELNLGEALPVVLRHLAERLPLIDVRFFVSAVLMQRETGGNLGEILTRLAHVIRERFRLKGQVRAVSAHSRITAGVLTAMPIVVVLALMAIDPKYFMSMVESPEGKYLISGALVAQVLGYLCMRKIINFEI